MNKNKNTETFEMAQIPYIEHKKRLFRTQLRVKRLSICMAVSNLLWLLMVVILTFVR